MIVLGKVNISHNVRFLNMTQYKDCTLGKSEYVQFHIGTQLQANYLYPNK